MSKTKFNITTNALAMSKITDIVESIGIENGNVPVFEFSEEGKQARIQFATLVHTLLFKDLTLFNEFFNSIVTDPPEGKDFTKLEGKECLEITLNFTKELPESFVNLMVNSIKELQKQRNSALAINGKAVEKAMQTEMEKVIAEFRVTNPEVSETDIKEIIQDATSPS